MNIIELRNAIIEPLQTFCGVTVFPADDMSEKPSEPHITYKITRTYGKGVGRPEETYIRTDDGLQIQQTNEYLATFSFNAFAMKETDSIALAQHVYDWFAFFGDDLFNQLGVAVAEQTDVTNRDAFVVENYERRNGFDVIMRIMDVKTRDVDWFDKITTTQIKGGNE